MQKVSDIRSKLLQLFYNEERAENGTIELIGESFIADEPSIFGAVNEAYVKKELDWYKSTSLNVNDIEEPVPRIWLDICDREGFINSNYGWCIYSVHNHNQYEYVLDALIKDKYSRQGVMIYTRPSMHVDSRSLGKRDFMCTNTVQALIRNDKLDLVVNMRSNDVVFGYKNDFAWQKYVQESLIKDLKHKYKELETGNIYWQTGSLHVYPRHFHLLGEYSCSSKT